MCDFLPPQAAAQFGRTVAERFHGIAGRAVEDDAARRVDEVPPSGDLHRRQSFAEIESVVPHGRDDEPSARAETPASGVDGQFGRIVGGTGRPQPPCEERSGLRKFRDGRAEQLCRAVSHGVAAAGEGVEPDAEDHRAVARMEHGTAVGRAADVDLSQRARQAAGVENRFEVLGDGEEQGRRW